MYWSKAQTFGQHPPKPLRAHTMYLVGEGSFYVFGGCDARYCFRDLYIFDADTMYWSNPETTGDVPTPRRAHSCTLVEGRYLYVFGGGDGPNYFNDLHILNTDTLTWTSPKQQGDVPGPRRAHTTCLFNRYLYLFGGGDGSRALNDVYRLDTSDMNTLKWQKLEPEGPIPTSRGYHTSTLVGSKLVVFGGSDGHECFSDCHILDLVSLTWTAVVLDQPVPRLSHTATLVGSYLFIIGGHDGTRYSNEVLLLNLVTMTWETRKIHGKPPSGRGYHTSVLYDSRLFLYGGYDGQNVFDDVWMLELSASAYLPQITSFEILSGA
jgi:N-acetylneuraminic acid mutarotase